MQALSDYQMYLQIERGLSQNSIVNYGDDVRAFQLFLEEKKIEESPIDCSRENIQEFIYETAKKTAHILKQGELQVFEVFLII